MGTPAEMTSHHGCQEGQGVVALQFGRSLKYETVGAINNNNILDGFMHVF